MRTEKSRFRRSVTRLQELMRKQRHLPIPEQVANLNRVLRGHFAYYGVAGNFGALHRIHRIVERYWHRMLCSRSRKGYITWDVFQQIKARLPLVRPKLFLPYRKLQDIAVL
jgi:RNA-directed DNA polymerase